MALYPTTISDQIEEVKDLDISYRVLHPGIYISSKTENDTIRIPYSSLCNKYKDYLSKIIEEVKLTDGELLMYRYNPKKLSEDLYGSAQLWDTILILNGCVSVRQFSLSRGKVKVYDPNEFKSYINEILITETDVDDEYNF